jgi:hypothetical protein
MGDMTEFYIDWRGALRAEKVGWDEIEFEIQCKRIRSQLHATWPELCPCFDCEIRRREIAAIRSKYE